MSKRGQLEVSPKGAFAHLPQGKPPSLPWNSLDLHLLFSRHKSEAYYSGNKGGRPGICNITCYTSRCPPPSPPLHSCVPPLPATFHPCHIHIYLCKSSGEKRQQKYGCSVNMYLFDECAQENNGSLVTCLLSWQCMHWLGLTQGL